MCVSDRARSVWNLCKFISKKKKKQYIPFQCLLGKPDSDKTHALEIVLFIRTQRSLWEGFTWLSPTQVLSSLDSLR